MPANYGLNRQRRRNPFTSALSRGSAPRTSTPEAPKAPKAPSLAQSTKELGGFGGPMTQFSSGLPDIARRLRDQVGQDRSHVQTRQQAFTPRINRLRQTTRELPLKQEEEIEATENIRSASKAPRLGSSK